MRTGVMMEWSLNHRYCRHESTMASPEKPQATWIAVAIEMIVVQEVHAAVLGSDAPSALGAADCDATYAHCGATHGMLRVGAHGHVCALGHAGGCSDPWLGPCFQLRPLHQGHPDHCLPRDDTHLVFVRRQNGSRPLCQGGQDGRGILSAHCHVAEGG